MDILTRGLVAEALQTFRELADLAPLHNPPNIMGIEAAEKVLPGLAEVVVGAR